MPFRICLVLRKGRDDENTSEEGLQLRSIEASRVFGYLTGLKKQKLDFEATKIGTSRGRPGFRGTLWVASRVPSALSTSNS